MAVQLLKQMHRKQWPSIHTVNRQQLTSCLTGNPGGVKTSHAIVLRTNRIPNLRPPARATDPAGRASVPKQAPAAPTVVECDKGCDRGYIEIDDRVAPCDCLPQRQAAAI